MYVNKVQDCKVTFVKLGDQKRRFEEMKQVLGKYRVKDENAQSNSSKISNLQSKIDNITETLNGIEKLIKTSEEEAASKKDVNTEILTAELQKEQEKIKDLIEKIDSETLMNKNTIPKEALSELSKLEGTFNKALARVSEFRSYEQTLNVPPADVPEIEQFQTKFRKRNTIWTNLQTFQELKKTWWTANFRELDAEQIVKTVSKYSKENLEMRMKMGKEAVDEVLD